MDFARRGEAVPAEGAASVLLLHECLRPGIARWAVLEGMVGHAGVLRGGAVLVFLFILVF
jgi:hypothetical protein